MAERNARHGFTLVETSVVVVVIGLVILTVYPALTAMRAGTQQRVTQTNLQNLMLAVATYVQANGCLPCPAPAPVSAAGFGRIRGDTTANPAACGICTVAEGIAPFMSLGIPASAARDGWEHWITMRVDPALTTTASNVIPPAAACLAGDLPPNPVTPTCNMLNASQKGLCRSGISDANRIIVQTPFGNAAGQQAAAIFVSHGAKGYGSYIAGARPDANNGQRIPFPATVPDCSASTGFTRCNANGDRFFVNAPRVDGYGNDPYDNVILFADRNSLVSQLGSGSCQTVW